jgi:hypothetical protein
VWIARNTSPLNLEYLGDNGVVKLVERRIHTGVVFVGLGLMTVVVNLRCGVIF